MTTSIVERRGGEAAPEERPIRPSAIVWINGRGAVIAAMEPDRGITTCTIDRGLEPEESYLRLVVHAIGDRERVMILGPSSVRLALERDYTSIYQRPDRLVDVEPAGPMDQATLVDRLRELSA
jgi:hypothetical protein